MLALFIGCRALLMECTALLIEYSVLLVGSMLFDRIYGFLMCVCVCVCVCAYGGSVMRLCSQAALVDTHITLRLEYG